VCDATTRNPGFTSGERLTDDDNADEAHRSICAGLHFLQMKWPNKAVRKPRVGIQGGLQWLARFHVAR
jgi:hypothetical protein